LVFPELLRSSASSEVDEPPYDLLFRRAFFSSSTVLLVNETAFGFEVSAI